MWIGGGTAQQRKGKEHAAELEKSGENEEEAEKVADQLVWGAPAAVEVYDYNYAQRLQEVHRPPSKAKRDKGGAQERKRKARGSRGL